MHRHYRKRFWNLPIGILAELEYSFDVLSRESLLKSRLNDFEEHLQSSIRIRFSTYSESTYLSSWTIRQGLSQGESRQGSEEDREEEHDEECQVEEEVGLTDSSEEGYPLPTTQHRKATHYPRPSRGRLPTTQQRKATHDPRPSTGRLPTTHDPAEEDYPRPSSGRLPTTHDPAEKLPTTQQEEG